MKPERTSAELSVGTRIAEVFERCTDSLDEKLANFPKYSRRQDLNRFLAFYEIFKHVLRVKGSIVECGVFRGFSLMSWAKLSAILEPENFQRRIYGFDTFDGFPSTQVKDANTVESPQVGDYRSNSYDELIELVAQHDADRFLGHIPKVQLIKGDISTTIPEFIDANQHLVISLLFIDCDLYDPAKIAIEQLLPRMPKGAVLAFDEIDDHRFPGETMALIDAVGLRDVRLERLEFHPHISFAVL